MKRIVFALLAPAAALLAACDLLLVDPAPAGTEVQLSLVPVAASSGSEYGDLTPGFAPTRRVQFSFVHQGASRDTIVPAVRVDDAILTRVLLRPEETIGWLEVQAELQMEAGAPVFRGYGYVDARAFMPRATLVVEPVAFDISGASFFPFTTLGDTTTLTAFAMFASGFPIDGAQIDWASDAPDVAEVVDGDELVTRGNGAAVLTASSLGASRDYAITVRQVPVALTGVGPADTTLTIGASFQARPFGEDGNGHPLHPGAAVTWTATGAVSVTSSGTVSANAVGAGTVWVSRDAVSYSLQVTVLP